MNPILKGQFFKEVSDESKKVIGWTVVRVESGDRNPDAGLNDPGLARAVVVRNDTRTSAPKWISYKRLASLVGSGEWVEASGPLKRGVAMSGQASEATVEEERRWKIIQPVLALERDVFFAHIRTPALKAAAQLNGITPECVWQYLCLYWQFGLNRKGLRTRHGLAGQKSISERLERDAKGEHPFRSYKVGRKPSAESDPGKPMAKRDISLCRRGAKMFLFKPSPDHKLRYKWNYAHTETLNLFYDRAANPDNPAPTLRQFEQAIRSDPDFKKLSARIVGKLAFLKDYRQLKNTSRSDVSGPGQLGQIDDVKTKVILIDEITGMPLGTGRVFVVADSWSKIIAGAHDTLEGSSFAEATECLFNTFSDKAQFKNDHALDFDLRYVPCSGVFTAITADNGPLGGSLPDSLASELCDILNNADYRPDNKADVESSFNAYLRQFAENMPGYNRVERSRGDDDQKIIAYLTPREFRVLLWKWIEVYNRRPLDGWLPSEALSVNNPPDPTPYQLWNWGIEHCASHLSYRPPDELRRALLARGSGTMTSRRGIKFKGLVYLVTNGSKTETEFSGLFPSTNVGILYDRKFVRKIFVETENECVVAELRPDLSKDFGHLTFAEIAYNKSRLAARRRAVKRDHNRGKCEFAALAKELYNASKKVFDARYGNEKQRKKAAKTLSVDRTRAKAISRERIAHAEKVVAVFTNAATATLTPPIVAAPQKEPLLPSRRLSTKELLSGA